MAAVMKILGWKAQGLRCPDHEVACTKSNGQPYKVSLIQMPNGTGKTTTLTLLRAALAGGLPDRPWDREVVAEMQKKGNGARYGSFEGRLSLNERRAILIMEFDFENGSVSYKTTYGPGQRPGFHSLALGRMAAPALCHRRAPR